MVPRDHFSPWQNRFLIPLPAQVPGLRGREHLPASFPMATAGWRGIFPGSPDEWSLIAVGEGFASAAQCTTDSSWQPYEGGLRQPGHSHCRKAQVLLDSFTVGECVYEWPSPPYLRMWRKCKDWREMVNFWSALMEGLHSLAKCPFENMLWLKYIKCDFLCTKYTCINNYTPLGVCLRENDYPSTFRHLIALFRRHRTTVLSIGASGCYVGTGL